MRVVGFASAKGAPGVTTTALALTLVWPRPVLLVEADPAGGDLLAGYLAGANTPSGGLLRLALAARRDPIDAASVIEHSLPLDPSGHRRVLPSPLDRTQGRPVAETIEQIVTAVAAAADPGARPECRDVLVDLGRIALTAHAGWFGVLSDLLLLVEPTLRGASAARSTLRSLHDSVPSNCRVAVVLTGDGTYRPSEVTEALEVPVVGTIAHDPATARALCGEAPTRRGFDRSALVRSARSLADSLAKTPQSDLAHSAGPVQRDRVTVGGPA